MSYSTEDTNWALSAKGNWWRRRGGIALVVGTRADGSYWAMRDGEFLKRRFTTKQEAIHATEFGGDGQDELGDDERCYD